MARLFKRPGSKLPGTQSNKTVPEFKPPVPSTKPPGTGSPGTGFNSPPVTGTQEKTSNKPVPLIKPPPVPLTKPPGTGPPEPESKPPDFRDYLTNMFSSLNTKFTEAQAQAYIPYFQDQLTDDITNLKDYLFKLKNDDIRILVIFILMLSLFLHCKDKIIDDATYGKYYNEYITNFLTDIDTHKGDKDTLYQYIMTVLYRQKKNEESSSSNSNSNV